MIFRCALKSKEILSLPKSHIEQAMYELLRAHQLGNHLLVLTHESADCLAQNFDFNLTQKALIRGIREKYAQYGNLHSAAQVYFELSPLSSFTQSGRAILVPMSSVTSALVGNPTSLVVEDISTDGFAFDFMFRQLKDLFNVPQFKTRLVHGGGSATIKVFTDLIDAGCLVVCVGDTDKASPEQPLSRDKKNLLSAADGIPIAASALLPCREMENTIFPDVMRKLPSSRGSSLLFHISKAEYNTEMELWLYLDLKNGISSGTIARFERNSQEWLLKKLGSAALDPANVTLSGFGDYVLSQLCRNNEALSIHRTIIRSDKWLKHFREFVEKILWWFVSSGGVRA